MKLSLACRLLINAFLLLCILLKYADGAELLASVYEEQPAGTIVTNVREVVNIPASVNNIKFNILSSANKTQYFHIDSAGNITTATVIDREEMCGHKLNCVYSFDIAVTPLQYFEIVRAKVEIMDVNDHDPYFPINPLNLQVPENAPIGHTVLLEPALDEDILHNSVQEYELKPTGGDFALKVTSDAFGEQIVALVVQKSLDREAGQSQKLKVIASDHGIPRRSGSVSVNIDITDSNDNAPAFEQLKYQREIVEHIAPSTTILQVKAVDPDYGPNGKITYKLSSRNEKAVREAFDVDPETGELFVIGDVDYEKKDAYNIYIDATDQGPFPLTGVTLVKVKVVDINDKVPVINIDLLSAGDGIAYISEGAPIGSFVAKLTISDLDSGENGRATAEILSDNAAYFALKPVFINEYMLVTAVKLDREQKSRYNLTIRVEDKGSPVKSSTGVLHVQVTDENDNAPTFNQTLFIAKIPENNNIGRIVTQVTATDRDKGENAVIKYHIAPPHDIAFKINPTSGIITTRTTFDREEKQLIDIKVVATDGGQPSLSSHTFVKIVLKDENDNSPVFERKFYSFSLPENQAISTLVGSVDAVDKDIQVNGEVEYSFSKTVLEFSIDPKTGGIYTNRKLDREKKDIYKYVVIASDQGVPQRFDSANVTIFVTDTNDNVPVITFPSGSENVVFLPETSPSGKFVCEVTAYDDDEDENAEMEFGIMDGNGLKMFDIDKHSGEITTTVPLRSDLVGLHKLILTVKDHGEPQNVAMATLNIIIHPGNTTTNETLMYLLSLHLDENVVDDFPVDAKTNITLILIMAGISAFLIIAVVILLILYRRKSRENLAYNVRTEAQRIFQGLKPRRKPSAASSDIEEGGCAGRTDPSGRSGSIGSHRSSADNCTNSTHSGHSGRVEHDRSDSVLTGNFSWVFNSRNPSQAGSHANSPHDVNTLMIPSSQRSRPQNEYIDHPHPPLPHPVIRRTPNPRLNTSIQSSDLRNASNVNSSVSQDTGYAESIHDNSIETLHSPPRGGSTSYMPVSSADYCESETSEGNTRSIGSPSADTYGSVNSILSKEVSAGATLSSNSSPPRYNTSQSKGKCTPTANDSCETPLSYRTFRPSDDEDDNGCTEKKVVNHTYEEMLPKVRIPQKGYKESVQQPLLSRQQRSVSNGKVRPMEMVPLMMQERSIPEADETNEHYGIQLLDKTTGTVAHLKRKPSNKSLTEFL